ncbi:MAG: metallophosphoesterase [Bacteroidales bacterium]|nr:metallophosphoesterase [Bacteroidales bacterium]
MKIQIISDLHLEFPENREWLKSNPLIPVADILLMAGDIICDKYKKKARFFYDQITKDFSFIISTMGNHEFYKGIIDYAYPMYKSRIAENFIRLNNLSHVIEDVKYIVSVLWSWVPEEKKEIISCYMNDYRLISHQNMDGEKYPLSVEDTNRYHRLSVQFIKEELAKPFNGKTVVMTHHLPGYDCIPDSMKGHELNSAYASDLSELILSNPQIKYWICGHSHDFNITKIGETLIIRNPLGYVFDGQQKDFKRDYCVEV